ncbi:MAG: hypothetical protein AAGC68_12200 [Verrucomicrobiota bacterium]
MRTFVILSLAVAMVCLQTSCGLIGQQARYARSILQWPFRSELDVRHIDGISDIDREWVLALRA